MADEASKNESQHAFDASSSGEADPPEWAADPSGASGLGSSASLAADVAKLWIQENQKKSLLGAFAIGVFVGAMLRD